MLKCCLSDRSQLGVRNVVSNFKVVGKTARINIKRRLWAVDCRVDQDVSYKGNDNSILSTYITAGPLLCPLLSPNLPIYEGAGGHPSSCTSQSLHLVTRTESSFKTILLPNTNHQTHRSNTTTRPTAHPLQNQPSSIMAPNNSPIITLEEHFMSQAAQETLSSKTATLKQAPGGLWDKFTELGPVRIKDMDAGRVTLQVISHGPGELSPPQCRSANNQLAAAVRSHPSRFVGFASLPMGHPAEAAAELRRTCIGGGGIGFVGALVESHTDAGRYYEGPEYDTVWEAASELDVPVYIHPTWPSDAVFEAGFRSESVPDDVALAISAFGFGWHSDVAMHIIRLYAAGVFDRFPGLKIIIGHFGEMIPYMLQRIERTAGRWGRTRSFRQVWDENIWLTTSGNWSLDPLATILRNTKKDRILYSVDYPFAANEAGLKWLEELEASGLVSTEELEGIRWKNSSRLLKLEVKA